MQYTNEKMATLGLPQKRIIPALKSRLIQHDNAIGQIYSKLLNSVTKVESIMHVFDTASSDEVQCSAVIKDFGTILCTISSYDLALLTAYYLNDLPFDGDSSTNNTMRRFFERLVLENIQVENNSTEVEINPSSPLPTLTLESHRHLSIDEHKVLIKTYYCIDAFEVIYAETFGKIELDKALISKQLNKIPLTGSVQLLSKSVQMSDIQDIKEGNVIMMNKLVPQLRFSDDLAFNGEIASQDTKLSFKLSGVK